MDGYFRVGRLYREPSVFVKSKLWIMGEKVKPTTRFKGERTEGGKRGRLKHYKFQNRPRD